MERWEGVITIGGKVARVKVQLVKSTSACLAEWSGTGEIVGGNNSLQEKGQYETEIGRITVIRFNNTDSTFVFRGSSLPKGPLAKL